MKLISEEKYLEHHGVPGMKWGHHKTGLQNWGKEAGKLTKNQLIHPILTGKANQQSINSEKSAKTRARRQTLYQNTKDLKDVNSRMEKMLADRKNKKMSELKDIPPKTNWFKEAHKVNTNNALHPFITDKANKESIKSEKSLGTRIRRKTLYQNTKDLKDVNSRIEKMLAEKKN